MDVSPHLTCLQRAFQDLGCLVKSIVFKWQNILVFFTMNSIVIEELVDLESLDHCPAGR